MTEAVIVFSGGQDSTTCLGWAMDRFEADIVAVTFWYGQKHAVELDAARKICAAAGVEQYEINIGFVSDIVDSALTSNGDVNKQHERLTHLPASFVPNRNALFLTIAHALAQRVGASVVVAGVCETDFSGYPDCREGFVRSIETALNKGADAKIMLVTPLMYLTKAQTFLLAEETGFLDVVLEDSHTCYNGDREHRHSWGYGCDKCKACELRAKGWREYRDNDRLSRGPGREDKGI